MRRTFRVLVAGVGQSILLALPLAADWEVVAGSADRAVPCGLALRPRDWCRRLAANDGVELFAVRIRVFARNVWDVAPQAGFELGGPRSEPVFDRIVATLKVGR